MIIALVEYIKLYNTVTSRDYAELISTFITLTEPKYRCDDCKFKYGKDKDKFKKHKDAMACHYFAEKPRHQYKPDFNNKENPAILYKKCIGNYYNGYFASLINDFKRYDSGTLPFEGGLYNQPAKFAEIMSLVNNLIREKEQEESRREKLRQSNGKRSGKR